MATYITDNTCEKVTICDPNNPELFCLPDGVLAKTLVPPAFSHWQYSINKPGSFDGFFDVDKYIKSDKYGQYYVLTALGTDNADIISGFDLLSGVDVGLQDTSAFPASTYSGEAAFFNIAGGGGNDIIVGAMNADILDGGDGDDWIGGAGGSDQITGGAGDDKIWGDGIIGLDNPLFIHDPWKKGPYDNIGEEYASSGNDLLDGGEGDDDIYGGYGDDVVIGGLGDDFLSGGTGNDDLYGGDGDDDMFGNAGNDWMDGGTGDDFMVGDGYTKVPGDDCMNGGDGDDEMWGDNGPGKRNDSRSSDHGWDKDDAGGNDRMLGAAGNDLMFGQGGDDKMNGGLGDDYVNGGDGNDLVDGGKGNDVVVGGDGADIIRGGMGTDLVYGGDGCDIFAFCEVDFNCVDVIADFSTVSEVKYGKIIPNTDQIDLTGVKKLGTVEVQLVGDDEVVRLNLLDRNGNALQSIQVNGRDGLDIEDTFKTDSAYGTHDGSFVKVAAGVSINLPSTSIIFSESEMFF